MPSKMKRKILRKILPYLLCAIWMWVWTYLFIALISVGFNNFIVLIVLLFVGCGVIFYKFDEKKSTNAPPES